MKLFNQKIFLLPGKFLENFPMLIVACLLIFMGLTGTWISFPLSGEVGLKELNSSDIYSQTKWLLLTLLGLYCVTTVAKYSLIRVLVSLGILCLILYLALHFSFFSGENISQYTQESKAFREIQHVFALNNTPNAGRSVETALAFDAFKFIDRIGVTLGVLGWGAKLAIICSALLFLYTIMRSSKVVFSSMISVVVMLFFFVGSGIGDVSLAYLKINQGVRNFTQGTNIEAMAQFNEAALLDPVLNYSNGFPLLTSYAYFTTYGPEDRNAYAYRISQEFVAGEFSSVFALNSYIQNSAVKTAVSAEFNDLSLPQKLAIERIEKRLVSNAYNRVGLLYLWHQEWAQAEQHFLMALRLTDSLVAKIALLTIYNTTKQYESCNILSDEILEKIHNHSMSADIWTTKGECLSASGYPSEARSAFQHSIQLDGDKNYRAVKGLSGT
ncbi:hypothetical protein [Paraglaciecola sp.]|uniref:tetratricopeptide repeat protein n=1 Tax=Paraglaciecola sp. TaxID=1920173 RepID=UPI0032634661